MTALLLVLVTPLVIGLTILVWRRNERDMSGRRPDGSIRFYKPDQFSPLPLMGGRQVPIPVRSRWWQVGLALVIYPWIGICALGVVWIFKQVS
jgi:hypothetical protein